MDVRYVSRKYVKTWAVETTSKATRPSERRDEDDSIAYLFQCRMWRQPDGSLTPSFLCQLLQRVLSQLMQTPGIRLRDLFDKFNPDLLPSALHDLLEILSDIGCLRMTCLKRRPRKTVFGRPGDTGTVEETMWRREGYLVLDVTVSAPICLAHFLGVLESHPGWNERLTEKDPPRGLPKQPTSGAGNDHDEDDDDDDDDDDDNDGSDDEANDNNDDDN